MIDINCRADLSGNLYQFCLDYTLKMEDILSGFSPFTRWAGGGQRIYLLLRSIILQ